MEAPATPATGRWRHVRGPLSNLDDRSALHGWLVAFGLAIGALALALLVGNALAIPAVLLTVLVSDELLVVLAAVVASEVGYLAVGLGALWWAERRIPLALPNTRTFLLGLAGALGLVVVGQALLLLIPGAGIDDLAEALAGTTVGPETVLWLGVVAVFLVGPAEELLFRGVIQGTLRTVMGARAAVAVASLVFAAVHALGILGLSALAGAAALTIILVGGVLFGIAYERTGSLVVPIVMHSVYDGALLGVGYLALTGRLPGL